MCKVVLHYLTVYAKATFYTSLSMRQYKKTLDKIPQLLVFAGFEDVARKQSTPSLLTLSYSLNSCKVFGLLWTSSATNDAYSFFRKSTSVSLTRLASKRMLRSLSNSLTEMLIGPAITWESRHLKNRTIGNFNGHFSSNFSLVRVRNTLQSSWNCLCSRCVICSFFLRSSTSLFVIIPMSTALLSLLLSSDVTSIFANDYCVKVLAEVVTLSFKNLLIIDLNNFSRSDARNGTNRPVYLICGKERVEILSQGYPEMVLCFEQLVEWLL